MIWRGPMVISALSQMLCDVDWAPLDVLVVDMPPGTGDAQLTMAQRVPLKGAVIVSTPQDIALIDARKGIAMFRRPGADPRHRRKHERVRLPALRAESHIFGHGGARATAATLGVPFLGEIPLVPKIREIVRCRHTRHGRRPGRPGGTGLPCACPFGRRPALRQHATASPNRDGIRPWPPRNRRFAACSRRRYASISCP